MRLRAWGLEFRLEASSGFKTYSSSSSSRAVVDSSSSTTGKNSCKCSNVDP